MAILLLDSCTPRTVASVDISIATLPPRSSQMMACWS